MHVESKMPPFFKSAKGEFIRLPKHFGDHGSLLGKFLVGEGDL